MMQRTSAVLIVLCVLGSVATLPRAAYAGRAWAWAEDAVIPTDSTNCTRSGLSQTTRAYSVVRCTTGAVGSKFLLKFQMPTQMPNNGPTAFVHFQTPTGVTGNCQYKIALVALPPNAITSASLDSALSFATPAAVTVGTADVRRVTVESAAIAIKNQTSGVTCTSTTCQGMDLVAVVVNTTVAGTGGNGCDFKMLELKF